MIAERVRVRVGKLTLGERTLGVGVSGGEVDDCVLALRSDDRDLVPGDAAEAPEEESDALGEGAFKLAF